MYNIDIHPKVLLPFAIMYNIFNCSIILSNLHSYNGLEATPQCDKDSFRNDHVKPLLLGQLLCATSACFALYTNYASAACIAILLEYEVHLRFQNYNRIANELLENGYAREVKINMERERVSSRVQNM